eukprot:Hpha_TRINITY_DN16789_c0_g5::TRINITY_DN16789_c0_g5_i6::g.80454::m.80454/K04940/odh; opine dehydrogenase
MMKQHEIRHVAVLGAGGGGKATAAELVMQGKSVNLWETPQYVEANLKALLEEKEPALRCSGQLEGIARLDLVTEDLPSALGLTAAGAAAGAVIWPGMGPVDTIFICPALQIHDHKAAIASMLGPVLATWPVDKAPLPLVVVNPGIDHVNLQKVWREMKVSTVPVVCEFSHLTYDCHAGPDHVTVTKKVSKVPYHVFPHGKQGDVGPCLEKIFPSLHVTTRHRIRHVAVLGAGNAGKATAAELAMQGKSVSLWEAPQFVDNLKALWPPNEPVLRCSGQLEGNARLDLVTDDLSAALGLTSSQAGVGSVIWPGMGPVDTIFICTVVQAHEPIARMLAPLLASWPVDRAPLPVVVLNPGSTGGSLVMAKIWKEMQVPDLPVLCEFGTLTYGCRAHDDHVTVPVKVKRVSYGVFPAIYLDDVGPPLEKIFPGLWKCPTVLAAGLCNANPVIHPAITLLNLGYMQGQGSFMRFYRDGASPMVCEMIKALDEERMGLMRALGYKECAVPDSTNSMKQGYAETDKTYYECYGQGDGYSHFAGPANEEQGGVNLAKHRYLQEDIGCGLVFFKSLADAVGYPMPVTDSIITIGSVVTGDKFAKLEMKTTSTVGLEGMDRAAIRSFLARGYEEPVCSSP